MSPHPIIVYGASGYTGKLIAEYLTRRRLPFVAAGRERSRIEEALRQAPGNHEAHVQAIDHDAAGLAQLLKGAQVVINVVGPFGQLGETVVQAALEQGVHYLDTSGEQDWAQLVRDRYGRAFAEKGLLLSPGCSFMWTAGMIAAEIALEDPAVDSLEILYAAKSAPTVASTLSFLRMLCLPNPWKQFGQMGTWPAMSLIDVAVPGSHIVHAGLPWGGGFEPIWLEHEPRVINCQVMIALPKGPMVDHLTGLTREYYELAKTKTPAELEAVTNGWGLAFAQTPAKEIPKMHQALISCHARGTTSGKQILLHVTSPYLMTGCLAAEAARRVVEGRLKATGFQPATRAFGHRELMAAMAEDGLHCWTERVL